MGIHICLLSEKGEDHKDWDEARHAEDREFVGFLGNDQIVKHPRGENYGFRFSNIDKVRSKILETNWKNKDRYLHLLDLMEKDTNYYLYISY